MGKDQSLIASLKKRQEVRNLHQKQMLELATNTLKGLPDNVKLECWTTSLIVIHIGLSSLRLNIVWKIGKEPMLRIEKDVQFLCEEGEQVRKLLVKQKKNYASIIIPEFLKMTEIEENS